jgi:hypothetical protein
MTEQHLSPGMPDFPFCCPCCGIKWLTRKEFLEDPEVKLLGYQVHFDCLKLGLFLFNHSCMSTFSLKAENFFDLYDGPVYQKRMTGTDVCPGYCLRRNCFEPCPAECECAFVREVLQIVKNYRKKSLKNRK